MKVKIEILESLKSAKNIYLWGAASAGHRAYHRLINIGIPKNRIKFIDKNYRNLPDVYGTKVLSPDLIYEINLDENLILISSTIKDEIFKSVNNETRFKLRYEHELLFSRDLMFKYPKTFIDFLAKYGHSLNLDAEEAYTLWSAILCNSQIPGDLIEIGVYKGSSVQLMYSACQLSANSKRRVIGIDTFEGIPSLEGNGDEKFANYLSDVNFDEVRRSIDPNIELLQGKFPEEIDIEMFESVCLLHLDVDTYKTTKDALNQLWHKLSLGGMIVIHDYNSQGCPGVKIAVDEWSNNKQITKIEVAECQLVIIKTSE